MVRIPSSCPYAHSSASRAMPDQPFRHACRGRYGVGRLPFVGEEVLTCY